MEPLTLLTTFGFGLCAGACLCLVWAVRRLGTRNRILDIERKLWVNKSLVREGQGKIFSDAETILTEAANPPPSAPMQVRSPFVRGKMNLVEQVREETRKEAGSYLPPEIAEGIKRRAEEVKAAAG